MTMVKDAKMKTILRSLVDGVLVFDGNGFIDLANRAAENIFLVREGDLVNKTLEQVGSFDEINNMIKMVLETGREVFREITIYPDIKTYQARVVPLKTPDGEVDGAVAVFHDITDAIEFRQMRSEFVGNVSHELRTPLTSIKGFVETLLDGAMENNDICRKFLSIIDAETERLTRLIEDLLTLSAIESKELTMRPQSVCLQRSIRQVMNIMGPQISEKKLHVELIYMPGMAKIYADEDLLGQVLINLLDNAIKYSPPEGKIIIRCRQSGNRVITTVSDSGIGIPPESKPRVFERFYRVDKARSRTRGGTGLGLAIVKHIVELHGGDIFVCSEYGKGATFGVSFLVC
ncbi:MAG: sensor histidine kinase [Syntrophomonadaceae bacterium]|jgi:two-component system phosphate regulon sensor histidine kinase PhoR